jgi:3-oxoacyl-ACP reductase-like protein
MRLIGAFFEFANRVIVSARKGGLPQRDIKKLDNLLTRTAKRNTILAKGILTALSAGGAGEQDIRRFGALLLKAEDRILQDKEPFTQAERTELSDLFRRAYVSAKTARWFSAQLDELVAEEINEFISGSRRVDVGVPSRKTVKFEKKEEKRKLNL